MTNILSVVKDDVWFFVNNHITHESVSVRTEYAAFKEVETNHIESVGKRG